MCVCGGGFAAIGRPAGPPRDSTTACISGQDGIM